MSVQAMAWVLDDCDVTRSTERLVLISIANHAGKSPIDDAWESWPGLDTIARESRLSKRTVQRCLDSLVQQQLLQIVRNGAPDSRVASNRRSNLYRIKIARGDSAVTPQAAVSSDTAVTPPDSSGVTAGVTDSTSGVTNEEFSLCIAEPLENRRTVSPDGDDPKLKDALSRKAHELTVLAFEQSVKPVVPRMPNPFVAVLGMIERELRSGRSVQDIKRAIEAGVDVWTANGLRTSIAQRRSTRRAGVEAGDDAARRFLESRSSKGA